MAQWEVEEYAVLWPDLISLSYSSLFTRPGVWRVGRSRPLLATKMIYSQGGSAQLRA